MTGIAAGEVAEVVGGAVEGDASVAVRGIAGLDDAQEGDLSFLSDSRYASAVSATRASVVIVPTNWKGAAPCTVIRVEDPARALLGLAESLGPPPVVYDPGVHPTAVLADDVVLGEGVHVGPHVVLDAGVRVGTATAICAGCTVGRESVIGEDCRIYPRVSIRELCRVGDRVLVHSGAVIGSDGFGYLPERDGSWRKIPQIGTVEIGDDVEIGANATIDRARFGKTVIGRGVKIDNLVHIAHNVCVGEHTAMAAQVGIAGSTTVGSRVQMGGQAGVADHAQIGDGSVIAAKAGVVRKVPPGTRVSGFPAVPHDAWRKAHAHVMHLPKMREQLKDLAQRMARLEQERE
jgi:UDP-3-O-[3-hydroxymyristoyl] glucosamine N-acyltransferase